MENFMKKCVLVLLCSLLLFTEAFAQINKKKSRESILVQQNKPSVFIQFERSGKEAPIFQGETEERIWLRIHNNTRWELSLCSFEVDKEYGDAGLVYDVEFSRPSTVFYSVRNEEEMKRRIDQKNKQKLPQGYSTGDTCTPFSLSKGKSFVFSVPREHLAKNLFIKIEFWYEWENRQNDLGSFPHYYLNFANTELPFEER